MKGVAKALIRVGGVTLLDRTLRTLQQVDQLGKVYVVGGAEQHLEQLARFCQRLEVVFLKNENWTAGMGASVEVGFASVKNDACLLWPVDCVGVTSETVRTVVCTGGPVVVPTYQGRGGHPTLFRRQVYDRLLKCNSFPLGAKSVVSETPGVQRVAVPDPYVLSDLDSPLDLQHFQQRLRATNER